MRAQTSGTERILYGLDDVKKSPEIIIVEGEMDKLALEEAGMRNVVSVPDGAPGEVKKGELPPPEMDTSFRYLWNCRAVLDQAVKIVLATDGDGPGQVGLPSLCSHEMSAVTPATASPALSPVLDVVHVAKNQSMPAMNQLGGEKVAVATAVGLSCRQLVERACGTGLGGGAGAAAGARQVLAGALADRHRRLRRGSGTRERGEEGCQ